MTKESHQFGPEGVVHFAGLKLITDSITQPLAYYLQNVTTTVNLLQAMDHLRCQKIVFSHLQQCTASPNTCPTTRPTQSSLSVLMGVQNE